MPDHFIEILLIEDEAAHAELIQRAFEGRSFPASVHTAASLAEARAYLASHAPALIIADWRLPDGDSLELLNEKNGDPAVPLIFMTSYGNERIAVEALKSGALDYVVKSPESLMDMPHIAERAIEQSVARQERARMQEALAESESQFRLLAENSSDMISRHDGQGYFLYASPACRAILGYEPDELIGQSALNYIHPEDMARIAPMLNLKPSENQVYTVSYRVRKKDGEYLWLESSARAILDQETGIPLEVHAASRNITERKSAQDALQAAHMELRDAYERTIEGWVRALDLRDRETEGHTQRVTETTLKVARAIGIPESEIIHIRRGALLHDIGKIAISDEILQKPGPLDEKEWEAMRRHPLYAYEVLYPITYLRPALEIPFRHHERWDGSGYPQGLKGEDIPLIARLFAIVDVWDALSHDRPYRKASPSKEVIKYLQQQAGRLFDPDLVNLFVSIVQEDKKKSPPPA
jgi:PAS domain S-box-containing protein